MLRAFRPEASRVQHYELQKQKSPFVILSERRPSRLRIGLRSRRTPASSVMMLLF